MCFIIDDEQFALQQKWVAKRAVKPSSGLLTVSDVVEQGKLGVADNDKGRLNSPAQPHPKIQGLVPHVS